MRIIFLGTSEFGAITLENIAERGIKPLLVITRPDKPAGRGKKISDSPVSVAAGKLGIPVLKPEEILEIIEDIRKENPDLIVVASYGEKIPKEILEIPRRGCVNIHPSLLPKYRGPDPVRQAILNRDEKTGVTLMLMNEEIDKGDVIGQKEYAIKKDIHHEDLLKDLSDLGASLFAEMIPGWMEGRIKPVPQAEESAVYTRKISKEDGRIDWKLSAEEISAKVRALNPWPGAYASFQDKDGKEKMIKILKAGTLKQTNDGPFGPPGKVYMAPNSNLAIQTGKDFLIVKELQMEGKKPVIVEEFLHGNIDFIGTILK